MTDSIGEPSRASGSAASKSKTSPVDIERLMRDERVVQFRREGLTYTEIAAAEGIGRSTVGDIMKKWLGECGPSAEIVDELRQLQGDQLDRMQAKFWPHLMRPLRDADGEIIYEGRRGNQRIEVPDAAVSQQVLRIMERRAKLYGLDMPANLNINLKPTAEQFAAFLGWDGEAPIDVQGEEIDDDPERLGLGPGD
jgi:hypothetical protein